jgi:hypothetical protein
MPSSMTPRAAASSRRSGESAPGAGPSPRWYPRQSPNPGPAADRQRGGLPHTAGPPPRSVPLPGHRPPGTELHLPLLSRHACAVPLPLLRGFRHFSLLYLSSPPSVFPARNIGFRILSFCCRDGRLKSGMKRRQTLDYKRATRWSESPWSPSRSTTAAPRSVPPPTCGDPACGITI